MAKNDEEIILEAYGQVNEGILARARAGLNDSLLGRAVNSVGNLVTGNMQGLSANLSQDSAHKKFDSLLNSHSKNIQKVIQKFITDLIKSNVINQSQGAKAQSDAFNAILNSIQSLVGQDKGTVLSNTVNAIGQGVKAIGNTVMNPAQTAGKVVGTMQAGAQNYQTAKQQSYNQNLINNQ